MANDLFDAYLEKNNYYRFEGESGVRDVEAIAKAIGDYDSMTEFLADNPAACELLVQFIGKGTNTCPEWKERLAGLAEVEDEDEDEDGNYDAEDDAA
jgi:hypothetical protein